MQIVDVAPASLQSERLSGRRKDGRKHMQAYKHGKKVDNAHQLLVSEHSQIVLLASCQTITATSIPARQIEHAYFEKKWTHNAAEGADHTTRSSSVISLFSILRSYSSIFFVASLAILLARSFSCFSLLNGPY